MIHRPYTYLALVCALVMPHVAATDRAITPSNEWNFLVYMSNNNNLNRYGLTNFRQMVQTGSNNNVNLLLQMDALGKQEVSRFFVGKENPVLMQTHTDSQISYSGTPANLIHFMEWGTSTFPTAKNCLVLWNHGSGIKDPSIWGRAFNHWRDNLFKINPQTGMLELDRSEDKRNEMREWEQRGIAFNDAAAAYLTNEDLKNSLEFTCASMLGGKKIDVIAMDACHMAMVEVASQLKTVANVMVGSEEVEPGSGYNYNAALTVFNSKGADAYALGRHFVGAYNAEYRSTLGDYTQSAVDLSYCDMLEARISTLSQTLLQLMGIDGTTGFKMLREIRFNRSQTTEFYDSDYIDLGHFCVSLMQRAQAFLSTGKASFGFGFNLTGNGQVQQQLASTWTNIGDAAADTLTALQTMVFANCSGRNLKNATGLSIYFPITSIHSSYARTEFAKNTSWPKFIERFIRMRFGSREAEPEHTKTLDLKGASCAIAGDSMPAINMAPTKRVK